MITKLYDKIKIFLKQNYLFFLTLIVVFLISTIKLPYYIDAPGGLVNLANKISIVNGYKSKGTLNMAYVSEMDATIPALIYAYFNKDWDIYKKEDVILDNETERDANIRSHLLLDEANQNAIIYVYNLLNKEVKITNRKVFITYIASEAITDLKVGDQLLKVNDQLISKSDDLRTIIDKLNVGDKVKLNIVRDNNEFVKYIEVINYEGYKRVGLIVTEKRDLEVDPKITLKFEANESGSSGGLMMSLAIYDALTSEDITKGKTVVGTGTIDINGNVGEISGIKYKLKGAVAKKAEIFFAPTGDNYNDAIKLKEKYNYDIEIIEVKHFNDALKYLKNI